MQKKQFGLCVVFVLLLGLSFGLQAEDKSAQLRGGDASVWSPVATGINHTVRTPGTYGKLPFQHTPNRMRNSPFPQKEGNTLVPPDLQRSQKAKKVTQALAGTGAIRGRVTQAPGGTTPIERATVWADRLDCPSYWGSAPSQADGYYVIEDLPSGDYQVYTYNDSVFVDLLWNNKQLWETPDPVAVVSNDTTENINFSLRVGGKITGTVTLPGASSVSVTIIAKNTTTGNYYYGSAIGSGSSATYVIKRLPTGTYKVYTWYNTQGYLDEYYDDKPDEASANSVPVTEGSITPSINFTLALGGKITGTVTLPGGFFVQVSISATDTTSGRTYYGDAFNYVGNSATYEVKGLSTGTYKVKTYNIIGYLDVYYDNKSDWASADPVSVTAGSTTSGKNFTLSLGGVITGNISGAKAPLENVFVDGFYVSDPYEWIHSTVTDADGNYSLTGLRSGSWKVFVHGDTTYAFEWYNNESNWSSADLVLVTAPDTVFKDFTLETGGSISGHVYDLGGHPLSGCDVWAYDSSYYSFYWFGLMMKSDTTSADGSYKIGGLRTGYYKVEAFIECDDQWYDHKSNWSEANLVHVTMPDDKPNIDFNLWTAVEDEVEHTNLRPTEFELHQNYPNPFNPETKIEYTLKKAGYVTLQIYNILGERVKTLVQQNQPAGFYQINWDGKNDKEKSVSSGLYLYKLEVNGFSEAKRMLLLK